MRALTHAIEIAVIPHMLETHRNARTAEINWNPSARQVEEFTTLLLDRDDTLASAYVERLLDAGTPIEQLHTKLMADAARVLGTRWDCDDADFADVTMGLMRMHRMLYLLDERFTRGTVQGSFASTLQSHRILLLPTIGEQHSFGLAMVAQFFRRAGWDVTSEQPQTEAAMAELLTSSWFDVVGISLGAEERLPALSTTISRVRKASRNPQLGVMVGGPVFVAQPGRFREVGADATAADAAQAIIEAGNLLSLQAQAG
jgi:methanogenic corrinoid protein MtbC1